MYNLLIFFPVGVTVFIFTKDAATAFLLILYMDLLALLRPLQRKNKVRWVHVYCDKV